MSRGIIYVISGERHNREAHISAEIVRETMPNTNIALFSDQSSYNEELFDEHIEFTDAGYGTRPKLSFLSESPYDRTIYLDSDIYVNSDISELFSALDRFDIALTLDPHQNQIILRDEYQGGELYSEELQPMPEFNSGVIAFQKTESVEKCFDSWEEYYSPDDHWGDQPALRKAAYEADVRICPLPQGYNYLPGLQNSVSGEVKIFHNRLIKSPDSDYKSFESVDELEQWIEKLNRTRLARVTYPVEGSIKTHNDLQMRPPSSKIEIVAHRLLVKMLKEGEKPFEGPYPNILTWLVGDRAKTALRSIRNRI